MRVLVRAAVGLAIVVGAAIVVLNLIFATYSYRYRLTISLGVDDKVRTGSSVIEIRWVGQPYLPGAGSFIPHVRGQAVFIDLGTRGSVIAALSEGKTSEDESDGSKSVIWLASFAFGNKSTNEELPKLETLRGKRNLSPDLMPRLIWFSDINDPKTARRFKVEEIPVIFGENAHMLEASVEITDDPIIINIERRIPWFALLKQPLTRGVIQIEKGFALVRNMFIGDAS